MFDMKDLLRIACLCGLLLVAAAASGCVAVAAAGAAGATTAYVRGNTEGLIEASPERILNATREVFEDMQFQITSSSHEGAAAASEDVRRWQLKAKSDAGESVKVTVERRAPQVSKVWVRVGFFGDDQFSRTIFDRIRARL